MNKNLSIIYNYSDTPAMYQLLDYVFYVFVRKKTLCQVSTLEWTIREKINYGYKNTINLVLKRSRRAERVPMVPENNSYAAVAPTTPPELGDTAV